MAAEWMVKLAGGGGFSEHSGEWCYFRRWVFLPREDGTFFRFEVRRYGR